MAWWRRFARSLQQQQLGQAAAEEVPHMSVTTIRSLRYSSVPSSCSGQLYSHMLLPSRKVSKPGKVGVADGIVWHCHASWAASPVVPHK
jgi:hypothetical protein